METRYPHLDPGARRLLQGPDEARIRYIQRDRFIDHGATEAVVAVLQDFVDRPPSVRPPCLALVGDAGNGKTTLLREFVRRTERTAQRADRQVAAYFVLSPLPTVHEMQALLLGALEALPAGSLNGSLRTGDDLRRALLERETRVVLIDEIQHLLNIPRRQRSALWDWFKWISTACRLSVACAGIPGSEEVIQSERQLQTRFTIVRLPRWSPGPAFGQFLAAFERSLPLKRPSGLGQPAMQSAFLDESRVMQQISGTTHGVKRVIRICIYQSDSLWR